MLAQVADNGVLRQLALPLVQVFRRKTTDAIGQKPVVAAGRINRTQSHNAADAARLQSPLVGNLEHGAGRTHNGGNAAGLVQDLLAKAEQVILLGTVMGGIASAVRRFNAQRIGGVVAGQEIIERSQRSAIIEAGRQGGMAAAIHADLAAILEQAGAGLDIHDAGGAVAIFGRQRAINQPHRLRQPGIERLAESRNAFRQDDAVQPILQAVMLAPHMQLAKGILAGARRLQDNLVQSHIVAAGLVLYVLGGDRIGGCPRLGLDAVARGLQPLGGDGDGFHLRRLLLRLNGQGQRQ